MNQLQKADETLQELADYLHQAMSQLADKEQHAEHRSRLKALYDRSQQLRHDLADRIEQVATDTTGTVRNQLQQWWQDAGQLIQKTRQLLTPGGGESVKEKLPASLRWEWPEFTATDWNDWRPVKHRGGDKKSMLQSSSTTDLNDFVQQLMPDFERWRQLMEETSQRMLSAWNASSEIGGGGDGVRKQVPLRSSQTIYLNVGAAKETPITLGYSVLALVYLAVLIRQYARGRQIAWRSATANTHAPSGPASLQQQQQQQQRPITPPPGPAESQAIKTSASNWIGGSQLDISQRSLLIFSSIIPLSLLLMSLFELNGMPSILLHTMFAGLFGASAILSPVWNPSAERIIGYNQWIPAALAAGVGWLAWQW